MASAARFIRACALALVALAMAACVCGCSGLPAGTEPAYAETADTEGVSMGFGACLSSSSLGYDPNLAIYSAELSDRIESSAQDVEDYLEGLGVRGYVVSDATGSWSDASWGSSGYAFTLGIGTVRTNEGVFDLIVVVCRGTSGSNVNEFVGDWLKGFLDSTEDFIGYRVFDNANYFYTRVWDKLCGLRSLGLAGGDGRRLKVLVTGHSLGGAAANMVGAKITSEAGGDGWWGTRVRQEDVFVYTFGGIKVLSQNVNVESGFENIHNVYNHYDSFGPNGNWQDVAVSDPAAKFGHTDLYDGIPCEQETGWAIWDRTTNNHNMPNYLQAVRSGIVRCANGIEHTEPEPLPDALGSAAEDASGKDAEPAKVVAGEDEMGSVPTETSGDFSIVGTWKSVGSYGFGQAQPGSTVMFDGQTANFFSPADDYVVYRDDGGRLLMDCTSVLMGDTLTFEIVVHDADDISVYHGGKETRLVRTSAETPVVSSDVWGDALDWESLDELMTGYGL